MLTKSEERKIAKWVNKKINIPLVPEFLEQIMFEQAVRMIDDVIQRYLPLDFGDLMRNLDEGIDEAQAKGFVDRLVKFLNEKIDIPYLSEEHERKLIKLVVDLLVDAMKKNKKLADLL